MPGNSTQSAGAACFACGIPSVLQTASNYILQTLGKQQHQVVRGSKIHDDGDRSKPSRR